MLKENLKHPLVIIFAIFVLLFLYSKFGPSLPFSVSSQQKGEPFIVSGTGKATAIPDIAKVSAGVEENGNSLGQVQKAVDTKSKSLTDSLKKLGIDEKDIKTTSYYVYPTYDYSVAPERITGYRVAVNYEITVRNIDKVNDVIAAATASGANLVSGVSFDLSDALKKTKLNEARAQAVNVAKDKAEGLAKAAGISLGKIINIAENQNSADIRPLALPVSGGGVTKEQTTPNVQPGTSELSVSVSLSYEIR